MNGVREATRWSWGLAQSTYQSLAYPVTCLFFFISMLVQLCIPHLAPYGNVSSVEMFCVDCALQKQQKSWGELEAHLTTSQEPM